VAGRKSGMGKLVCKAKRRIRQNWTRIYLVKLVGEGHKVIMPNYIKVYVGVCTDK
jgi:hypothetical protein